ncbi:MAG TPA: septal ring lytic transglycosylase RlpA family protein [Candidatus Acidoferrum sp.]|nr:septal ring lytic transglycosylase RlpA family protein [Candidatus Acidoferrum sp.]
MRAKAFVMLESVFLGVALLAMTLSANPNATVSANTTHRSATSLQNNSLLPSVAQLSHATKLKPLAVWDCTSSWYGEDFDGQPTATGETYDMYGATAAHPTLPLGSLVLVTNTKNHRSEVVRINDRGPYVRGRELDVTYQVARDLGFDEKGLAKVQIALLEVPSRPNQIHGE